MDDVKKSDQHRKDVSSDRERDAGGLEEQRRLGESRRRLLKGGASAAPILLTLTSRPVLAWDCKAPSAHASLSHASHHPGAGLANDGTRTIAYWSSQSAVWPSPYHRDTTLMHGTGAFPGARYGTKLMRDVLRAPETAKLDKYLIAALLNTKLVPNAGLCLSDAQLGAMFTHGPLGSYQPSSGINWGAREIVEYLRINWIVAG